MRAIPLLLALTALAAAAPAQAACVYRGTANAKTTLAQEYRDATWVVLARVEAVQPLPTGGRGAVIYRLRTVTPFKGVPSAHPRLFAYKDSGGFYPTVGADYLLFLNPPPSDLPRASMGVVDINYACGQSRPWRAVSAADRQRLAAAAAAKRR
ncbi:hypothetical protein FPZ24_15420 [Sphingomonas panacisoli]|uniref:Uncharacterized protein n=1 Tax=Sphingomonas panacisoli TaxID=1813879 RepID=A0A5B8LM69_9SPHN|nr:hypothetical protein [Sphingomonas panacisoli]QDZ08684.1 hypothetical protein FPZ24_15420 [Sphingomonas panacisoli]